MKFNVFVEVAIALVLAVIGVGAIIVGTSVKVRPLPEPQGTTLTAAQPRATFSIAKAEPILDAKKVNTLTLATKDTVILAGEIGENATRIASEITHKADTAPVYLLISTPGGSVLDGAQIVNAVQHAKHPVYTVCYEICASMGAIIFSYGEKRYMTDRSILMYHEASGGLQGQMNQMKSRLITIDHFVNKMDVEIANRVGLDYQEFKILAQSELWMDSDDAVRTNFADSVVNPDISALLKSNHSVEEALSKVRSFKTKILVNGGENK